MPENTFDIVSKIELPEVSNAIQQSLKEILQRFDLKNSKSNIELEGKDAIVLHSADEYKLKAVNDVLQQKLVKRGVSLKQRSQCLAHVDEPLSLRVGEPGDADAVPAQPRCGGCRGAQLVLAVRELGAVHELLDQLQASGGSGSRRGHRSEHVTPGGHLQTGLTGDAGRGNLSPSKDV